MGFIRPVRRGLVPRSSHVIQTQVLLAIVGAIIIMVVAESLARAFAIVVPHSVLRTAPPDTGDIFEIPAPGVGHAVWVEVFLGKAGSLTAAGRDLEPLPPEKGKALPRRGRPAAAAG